jgi:hypothetical protein
MEGINPQILAQTTDVAEAYVREVDEELRHSKTGRGSSHDE